MHACVNSDDQTVNVSPVCKWMNATHYKCYFMIVACDYMPDTVYFIEVPLNSLSQGNFTQLVEELCSFYSISLLFLSASQYLIPVRADVPVINMNDNVTREIRYLFEDHYFYADVVPDAITNVR